MNIGKTIKELRLSAGISQQELAEAIQVNRSAVSFWESGINEPKATYIARLATFFGVTSDYLLGLENWTNQNIRQDAPRTLPYLLSLHVFHETAINSNLWRAYPMPTKKMRPTQNWSHHNHYCMPYFFLNGPRVRRRLSGFAWRTVYTKSNARDVA